LVFEDNAIFFAENWQKSQKIVIITSTPDDERTDDFIGSLAQDDPKLIQIIRNWFLEPPPGETSFFVDETFPFYGDHMEL
jgi:hypothetical protein